MPLNSSAGPLPSTANGIRFPLSADAIKSDQPAESKLIPGAEAAIFATENGFFHCRQRNYSRAIEVKIWVAGVVPSDPARGGFPVASLWRRAHA